MKVLILAGGYATRMYPLTLNRSKPLLPVGKKLMIDWIIDKVMEIPGVNEIAVVTNEKFYKDYLEWKQKSGHKITLINDRTTSDENRLGMFGDISFGLKNMAHDDVLVVGGDNLFRFDLNELVELSREKNAPAIGAVELADINEARKMGIFRIDKNKKAVDFEEKPNNPTSMLASTACYMIPARIAKLIREFDGNGERTHLAPFLMQASETYVFPYKEEWIDIGSKEQYDKVNKEYSGQ